MFAGGPPCRVLRSPPPAGVSVCAWRGAVVGVLVIPALAVVLPAMLVLKGGVATAILLSADMLVLKGGVPTRVVPCAVFVDLDLDAREVGSAGLLRLVLGTCRTEVLVFTPLAVNVLEADALLVGNVGDMSDDAAVAVALGVLLPSTSIFLLRVGTLEMVEASSGALVAVGSVLLPSTAASLVRAGTSQRGDTAVPTLALETTTFKSFGVGVISCTCAVAGVCIHVNGLCTGIICVVEPDVNSRCLCASATSSLRCAGDDVFITPDAVTAPAVVVGVAESSRSVRERVRCHQTACSTSVPSTLALPRQPHNVHRHGNNAVLNQYLLIRANACS